MQRPDDAAIVLIPQSKLAPTPGVVVMDLPSITSLASIATLVWREIRITLKSQGLLDVIDEHRLAGYTAIVTGSQLTSVTRDKQLEKPFVDAALRAIAVEATRWRWSGQRLGTDPESWLQQTRAVLDSLRCGWEVELFDLNGRLRVLTLSRSVDFVRRTDITMTPDAASAVSLTLMHSLMNTAQQTVESALAGRSAAMPRRVFNG